MERTDLEAWFAHHPESIPGDPDALLDECESSVREHARSDAWSHAREIAEQRMRRFERITGLPASETFVTKEVCHELARELKHHEPHPDDATEDSWLRQSLLDGLDPEARVMLREWVNEMAEKEEHAAWLEIVDFTDHAARSLIRAGQMTSDLDWDFERTYPRVAARVARMLIREYETRAES